MDCQVDSHPWSVAALLGKARLYSERMHSTEPNRAEYALWSAIALELLARAALANVSPVLLADEKNWRNISYALGETTTAKKFNPTSIGIKEVFARLSELDPRVTQEIINFCASHLDRRNSEVHTGELAFFRYDSSVWLPKFYQASEVLLSSVGERAETFFANAGQIRDLIDSLSDQAAQSVRQDIAAYAKVWKDKAELERERLAQQAGTWATRHNGHRVTCPACGCPALVSGTPTGTVITSVIDDEIEQKQSHIPSSFECIACGLRISGFSKLAACSLGNAFTATSRFDASQFFGLFTEEDIESAVDEAEQEFKRNGFEPDFND